MRLKWVMLSGGIIVFAGAGAVAENLAMVAPSTAPAVQQSDPNQIVPPASGETLSRVEAEIQRCLQSVHTVCAEVEMSKARKGKSRKVKAGPMEVSRRHGARIALTRKNKTEEYIATSRLLWSYEHKEKEAQYIPTNLPVISTFVHSAMDLNMLPAMNPETMKLLGSAVVEGEPCWVIEGKSPDTLEVLGVPVVKMRVWVCKRDGIPRRISLPKESDTLVCVRHVRVNAPVTADRFNWSPPSGVRTKNIFGF